jgi:hypothetical protein
VLLGRDTGVSDFRVGSMRVDPIAVRDLIILVTVVALLAGTLLALRATQPKERRRRRE